MEVVQISDPGAFPFPKGEEPNFFCAPFWLGHFGAEAQMYAVMNGDIAAAVFHLYTYRRAGLRFVINSPLSPHIGLTIFHEAETIYARNHTVKQVLRAVTDFLESTFRGAMIDFALPANIRDPQPFQRAGILVTPKISYRLDLMRSEPELLKQMSTKRRRSVKTAEKEGLEFLTDVHGSTCRAIINATLKKAGTAAHEALLDRLFDAVGDKVFYIAVSRDGLPVATALAAGDKRCAHYIIGGHSDAAGPHAGTAAVWALMREAKRRGFREFDFNGSSVPSVEQFFRGFGAEISDFYRVQSSPAIVRTLHEWAQKLKTVG